MRPPIAAEDETCSGGAGERALQPQRYSRRSAPSARWHCSRKSAFANRTFPTRTRPEHFIKCEWQRQRDDVLLFRHLLLSHSTFCFRAPVNVLPFRLRTFISRFDFFFFFSIIHFAFGVSFVRAPQDLCICHSSTECRAVFLSLRGLLMCFLLFHLPFDVCATR